uniref:hypothetical protein n=1 Tax=Ningiella ruwaisensis TaxID=2364274 RepID=UPI003BA904B2
MVLMEQNKSQETQVDKSSTAQAIEGRRKFLRKTAAGALIASIPAKSVWATNGLTNSIVASGHGSDFAGGTSLVLRHPDQWLHTSSDTSWHNITFKDMFGSKTIGTNKNPKLKLMFRKDRDGNYIHGGPANINVLLVSAVLNAMYHDGHNIIFPVVSDRGMHGQARPTFRDIEQFKSKMYALASASPHDVARELSDLHSYGTVSRLSI